LGNAAHDGDVDRMRKLLAYGASANTLCTGGDLIIHKLAARGNQPAVEALLRYGALVDERDGRGATPLQLAAVHNHAHQAAHGGSVGVIATLLRHGASAAGMGNLNLMRLLLRYRATVNIGDSTGRTALHKAAYSNQVGAIHLLVEAGAGLNARDSNGRTPLHRA
ncbi:unnamed protein product, partial [Laminaria digitata]